MACRCEDVEMIKRDLAKIEEARSKIDRLLSLDGEVSDCFGEIGTSMDETLIVPQDDLERKIKNQNALASESIAGMSLELKNLEESLLAELEAAMSEDSGFHLNSFMGNLQNMFGG